MATDNWHPRELGINAAAAAQIRPRVDQGTRTGPSSDPSRPTTALLGYDIGGTRSTGPYNVLTNGDRREDEIHITVSRDKYEKVQEQRLGVVALLQRRPAQQTFVRDNPSARWQAAGQRAPQRYDAQQDSSTTGGSLPDPSQYASTGRRLPAENYDRWASDLSRSLVDLRHNEMEMLKMNDRLGAAIANASRGNPFSAIRGGDDLLIGAAPQLPSSPTRTGKSVDVAASETIATPSDFTTERTMEGVDHFMPSRPTTSSPEALAGQQIEQELTQIGACHLDHGLDREGLVLDASLQRSVDVLLGQSSMREPRVKLWISMPRSYQDVIGTSIKATHSQVSGWLLIITFESRFLRLCFEEEVLFNLELNNIDIRKTPTWRWAVLAEQLWYHDADVEFEIRTRPRPLLDPSTIHKESEPSEVTNPLIAKFIAPTEPPSSEVRTITNGGTLQPTDIALAQSPETTVAGKGDKDNSTSDLLSSEKSSSNFLLERGRDDNGSGTAPSPLYEQPGMFEHLPASNYTNRASAAGNNRDPLIANGREYTIENDQDPAIETDRRPTMRNDQDLAVGNNQDLAIENNPDLAVENNQDLAIENGRESAIGNNRDTAIEADRRPTIENNRDPAIENGRESAIGKDRDTAIEADRQPTIESNQDPAIENGRESAIGGNRDPAIQDDQRPAIENKQDAAIQNHRRPAIENDRDPAIEKDRESAIQKEIQTPPHGSKILNKNSIQPASVASSVPLTYVGNGDGAQKAEPPVSAKKAVPLYSDIVKRGINKTANPQPQQGIRGAVPQAPNFTVKSPKVKATTTDTNRDQLLSKRHSVLMANLDGEDNVKFACIAPSEIYERLVFLHAHQKVLKDRRGQYLQAAEYLYDANDLIGVEACATSLAVLELCQRADVRAKVEDLQIGTKFEDILNVSELRKMARRVQRKAKHMSHLKAKLSKDIPSPSQASSAAQTTSTPHTAGFRTVPKLEQPRLPVRKGKQTDFGDGNLPLESSFSSIAQSLASQTTQSYVSVPSLAAISDLYDSTQKFGFINPVELNGPGRDQALGEYRVAPDRFNFFVRGKVFAVWWHIPYGTPQESPTERTYPDVNIIVSGKNTFPRPRVMVVLTRRKGYSWCLAVETYSDHPWRRSRLKHPGEDTQTILYDSKQTVDPLSGSQNSTKRPLAVTMAPGETLSAYARLNFDSPYKLFWNCMVKAVGDIAEDHIPYLIRYAKEELFEPDDFEFVQ